MYNALEKIGIWIKLALNPIVTTFPLQVSSFFTFNHIVYLHHINNLYFLNNKLSEREVGGNSMHKHMKI